MSQIKPTLITLRNVRINHVAVFEPSEYQGRKSYNIQLLLPKGSAEEKQALAAQLAACEVKWPGKDSKGVAKGARKLASFIGNNVNCVSDGDLKDFEPLEGHTILRATRDASKVKPVAVDRYRGEDGKLERLKEEDGKIYPGVWVNATVEFWAQDGENPGSRCSFINVQFVKHGTPLGGGVAPSEVGLDELDFEEDDDQTDDLI